MTHRSAARTAATVLVLAAATLGAGAGPAAAAFDSSELVPALTLNDVTVPLGQTVRTGPGTPDAAARAQSCTQMRSGTAGARAPVPAPEVDHGNGLAAGAKTDAPAGLPKTVPFKTGTETYNRRYWFALRAGRVWFRSNQEVTGIRQPWRELPLPPCFSGRVTGIQADDDEMILLDRSRKVFVMDHALRAPALFNFTDRWGPLFWSGYGRNLTSGYTAWAWSVIDPAEDVTWKDAAGNAHPVGADKVSHIWTLRDGGRRLAFIDPWIAKDDSYEACAPVGGRFRAVNLAASGSTLMVIGRHGDIFTRLYDFDIAGNDPVYFHYSYDSQKGVAHPAIQLPSPAWVAQPKVPGRITSVISVEKRGKGSVHRTLRVEGLDKRRRTGFWQKDVTAKRWTFHATGRSLLGRRLDNPARNTARRGLAPARGRDYAGPADGGTATVAGFDVACSPARLRVVLGSHTQVDLALHSVDGLRLSARAVGLDAEKRDFYGAIEVPAAVRASKDPLVTAWLAKTGLGGRRFTTVPVTATSGMLVVKVAGHDWVLAPTS